VVHKYTAMKEGRRHHLEVTDRFLDKLLFKMITLSEYLGQYGYTEVKEDRS
jgi:hypothetical protein